MNKWIGRSRKAGLSLEARFWEKVLRTDDGACWEWQAGTTKKGYGQIRPGAPGRGYALAHRVSWEMHYGPIPDGLWVCHRCDNPPCVNPDHLFLESEAGNRRDMYEKGRASGGRMLGSSNPFAKLTEAQVAEIKRSAREGEDALSLAERFGVTRTNVYDIVKGKRWAHVEIGAA